jgi:hypothetical protein
MKMTLEMAQLVLVLEDFLTVVDSIFYGIFLLLFYITIFGSVASPTKLADDGPHCATRSWYVVDATIAFGRWKREVVPEDMS